MDHAWYTRDVAEMQAWRRVGAHVWSSALSALLALAYLAVARVREALEASRRAQAKLAAFGKRQPDAPHPKRLDAKLATLHQQAATTLKLAPDAKLTPRQRYAIGSAMAGVIEAQRVALLQQLRGDEPHPFSLPALSPRGGKGPGKSRTPKTKR